MTKQTSIVHIHEELRQLIASLNLTDDFFFCKAMEDVPTCEEFIRILTGKHFIGHEVHSQYSIRNIATHSVVLDILAETALEHAEPFPNSPLSANISSPSQTVSQLVNIEMQMSDHEDHLRRARYNQSCIDVSSLEKGISSDSLPELYLLFITRNDFIGDGEAIYQTNRITDSEHHRILDNGVHEYSLSVGFFSKSNQPRQISQRTVERR